MKTKSDDLIMLEQRILHNNNVAQLLAVDSPMLQGRLIHSIQKHNRYSLYETLKYPV